MLNRFFIVIIAFFFIVLLKAEEINYDFIVSQDGSGDFTTVQEVIDAIPHLRGKRTYVLIKKGVYKEKLLIPSTKNNISLIGEDVDSTIITFDDHAKTLNRFDETLGTSGSSSVFIYGNNFHAENITFANTAGPIGQAVAVRVDGDKVSFTNCRFLGNQDTLYPHGENSRQYYKNCYIEGSVDFIFGWSTAVFDSCQIHCVRQGGYITAASTHQETEFGLVFMNCKLTGIDDDPEYYLGRPWRPYAKTVFLECEMGNHIKQEGWHNWGKPDAEKTAFYAEYKSTGAGSHPKKRVKWAYQLSDEEAKIYTLKNIFKDWDPTKLINLQ